MYIAMRKSVEDGHTWLDTESLSDDLETCKTKSHKWDKRMPGWVSANPVYAYAECKVVVMHSGIENLIKP